MESLGNKPINILVKVCTILLESDEWIAQQMRWVTLMDNTREEWEATIADIENKQQIELVKAQMQSHEFDLRKQCASALQKKALGSMFTVLHGRATIKGLEVN